MRIVYFDFIRIIACVLVVMVHISAQGMETMEMTSMDFFAAQWYNGLAFCGVALFVMLSGALSLSAFKDTSLKKIVVHKTGHFLLVYFVWKAFYQVVTMLENHKPFTGENIKNDIVLALVQERGYYHLWFFLMLAMLFLFVPMIKPSVQNRTVCIYYLVIFSFVSLVYPAMMHYEFKFKYLLADFMQRADLYLFTGYLGYFVLGHFLNRHVEPLAKWKRWTLLVVAVGCTVITAGLSYTESGKMGGTVLFWNTPFNPFIMVTSIGIFLLAKELNGRMEEHTGIVKWLQRLAPLSLGVCLVHPLIIHFLNWLSINPEQFNRWLSIPGITILCTLLSGVAVFLWRWIPGLRRLLS